MKSAESNIIIYYENVRGLRTKLDLVKNNIKILTPKPDIIILTETWFCQDINDNEIGILGYNIVRKDRYRSLHRIKS